MMSALVKVTIKDLLTGEELLPPITLPRVPVKGETIFIGGIKYWVENVEWVIRKDEDKYWGPGKFTFAEVRLIVDTANRSR